MKRVSLTTDGSCLGNPGPGGWACVLEFGAVSRAVFGYDPHTTNNRMEMMAAIQGLLALKEPCEVEVTTDSEYVRRGITSGVIRWKRRGWWKRQRPIPNADLWMELEHLTSLHKTEWLWTKGHAGHAANERCDFLAQEAALKQTSSFAGRPHAPTRLGLPSGYAPPRPQLALFEEDDDDDEDGDG